MYSLREREREKGRERRRGRGGERGRKGERERGRKGGRDRERERGREGGREGGREREGHTCLYRLLGSWVALLHICTDLASVLYTRTCKSMYTCHKKELTQLLKVGECVVRWSVIYHCSLGEKRERVKQFVDRVARLMDGENDETPVIHTETIRRCVCVCVCV